MPVQDSLAATLRVARFESVEERLVLSASPWPGIVHHAELDTPTVDEFLPAIDSDGTLQLDDLARQHRRRRRNWTRRTRARASTAPTPITAFTAPVKRWS